MYDLLLTGGMVVDGTGGATFRADVAVKDGRVVALLRGAGEGVEATRTIDCSDRFISPGWVDFHGHADWSCLEYPEGLNLLMQGCTFTVAGNCGLGPGPVLGPASELLLRGEGRGYHGSSIDRMAERFPRMEWSMGDFLAEVERAKPGVNFAQLAGHNRIRQSVMGHEERAATGLEIERMRGLLEECLDAGAFGVTTGLVYIPSCWATMEEAVEMAKVAAKRDGYYASHIRGERETNVEATAELIETAERAGVRANVSHMQSKWPVFGNGSIKVDMLNDARARGVDITCDYEIYNMNSATLGAFLQVYHYSAEQLVGMLQSKEGRERLKRTMREIGPLHPLGRFGPGGVPYRKAWDRIVVWDCPHDRSVEGRSIAALAVERGQEAEEVLFDLTLAEGGLGPKLINDYIEDEHYRIVPWEHCIVPSVDTGFFDPTVAQAGTGASLQPVDFRYQLATGAPSPIGFFPRVLGQFVREEGLFSLEEGVRRMTSLPLSRLGISDRGVVKEGAWADLVVFDPRTIAMRGPQADAEVPETCWPVGIDYVVVNGEVAMEGHRYTGARAGQVVRM